MSPRALPGYADSRTRISRMKKDPQLVSWKRGFAKSPRAVVFRRGRRQPPMAWPEMRIEDRAILVYRDHVTTAGLSKAGESMGFALPGTDCRFSIFTFQFSRERLDDEGSRRNRSSLDKFTA